MILYGWLEAHLSVPSPLCFRVSPELIKAWLQRLIFLAQTELDSELEKGWAKKKKKSSEKTNGNATAFSQPYSSTGSELDFAVHVITCTNDFDAFAFAWLMMGVMRASLISRLSAISIYRTSFAAPCSLVYNLSPIFFISPNLPRFSIFSLISRNHLVELNCKSRWYSY